MNDTTKTTVCLAAAFCACAAWAQTFGLKSPDGKNEIKLSTEPELRYSVLRNGRTLVAPSAISMTFAQQGLLGGAKAKVKSSETRSVAGKIPTPVYKKAFVDESANALVVAFEGDWRIALVARNDGVAFRYETEFSGSAKVVDESVEVAFPTPEQDVVYASNNGAWKGDPFQCSWEKWYLPGKVKDLDSAPSTLYYAPLTVLYKDAAMAVTESDLRDYAGWNFRRDAKDPAKLVSGFAKWPAKLVNYDWELGTTEQPTRYKKVEQRADYVVETAGTRTYPWRLFLLADDVAQLPAQDAVYALAAGADPVDWSWVKPGKVAWDWWNFWNVSGVDFRAGCNTRTYEYYVDFAKEFGVEYVIFDEGWSQKLKILEIHPDVDVPHLIKYAKKRGVGIILWAAWAQFVGREEQVVEHYAKMGAAGFKVDFMDRDDADVVRFVEKLAKICAKHKMLLDYHGMYKPTGLQRTYPNVLNFEGVAGLEQMKWDRPYDAMSNDCVLVYTRMAAGPMDYTPGAMRNFAKGTYAAVGTKPGSEGTRAHQMALMALYEAPLQMLCDSPTQYLKNRECFEFMAGVPTVWDDTVCLEGKIGAFAAIARRKGETWYLSAIANWDGAEKEFALGFLGEGKWKAEIFRDGVNADRDAEDYVRETKAVTSADKLKVKFAPGGGLAVKFTKKGLLW
ncbi:MAG: glycoside hydrolase family 97 protein [Kiritimatiellae bacterium]|nr:glycoside hydrolase family 97 protein [Kiritimatiellia bacterium]